MLDSQSERIAFVRTIAPLAWSFLITRLADWGIDFDGWLSDQFGGGEEFINGAAVAVIAVALWVLARAYPRALEKLVLWIPIGDYAYTQGDDLVLPSGRLTDGATVVEIPPGGVSRVDDFTTAFLARQPSEVALRSAAGRLMDAAEQQ